MSEPRDIEKDKQSMIYFEEHLMDLVGVRYRNIANYYITQYEAQKSRIAELEQKQTSRMVHYETTYDHEGTKDSDAFCPVCDREQEVDYCYCPDCGQNLHWEPQNEEEANRGAK